MYSFLYKCLFSFQVKYAGYTYLHIYPVWVTKLVPSLGNKTSTQTGIPIQHVNTMNIYLSLGDISGYIHMINNLPGWYSYIE